MAVVSVAVTWAPALPLKTLQEDPGWWGSDLARCLVALPHGPLPAGVKGLGSNQIYDTCNKYKSLALSGNVEWVGFRYLTGEFNGMSNWCTLSFAFSKIINMHNLWLPSPLPIVLLWRVLGWWAVADYLSQSSWAKNWGASDTRLVTAWVLAFKQIKWK